MGGFSDVNKNKGYIQEREDAQYEKEEGMDEIPVSCVERCHAWYVSTSTGDGSAGAGKCE